MAAAATRQISKSKYSEETKQNIERLGATFHLKDYKVKHIHVYGGFPYHPKVLATSCEKFYSCPSINT